MVCDLLQSCQCVCVCLVIHVQCRVVLIFCPSAAVSRDGLMESCIHVHVVIFVVGCHPPGPDPTHPTHAGTPPRTRPDLATGIDCHVMV